MWLLICLNSCKSFGLAKRLQNFTGLSIIVNCTCWLSWDNAQCWNCSESQFLCDSMLWFSPSPRQSMFNSQTKHIFLLLSKAAKSALGISATGWQGGQGLCTQHLQWSNEGHVWKAVASWNTQTLHLSSLVAEHKGQGGDASDLKAQERKSRDVTGIFFRALFRAYNTVSLLWKITWLLF